MQNQDQGETQTYLTDGKNVRVNSRKERLINALRGLFRDPTCPPYIEYGKTISEVPNKKIRDIEPQVLSAFTAPDNAIEYVHKLMTKSKVRLDVLPDKTPIAGIHNWNKKVEKAFGIVTSLYDEIKETGKRVGEPIADCLAVISRTNNGILVLADGVSWGEKSRLAASCAVYGCIKHLCEHLADAHTTKDVFKIMVDSFETANYYIVDADATMSTLCASVVVELQEKNKWGVCMVNVGDSLGFVYDPEFGVAEITVGSHPIDEPRDMRFAGGALGPVDGSNPDLTNLTCSYACVNEKSIVFLASDGICDNFDPQVGHFPVTRIESQPPIKKSDSFLARRASTFLESISTKHQKSDIVHTRKRAVSLTDDENQLCNCGKDQDTLQDSVSKSKIPVENSTPFGTHSNPLYTPEERHNGMLEKMREVIEEGFQGSGSICTARDVCARCLNFALKNTEGKRNIHEKEGLDPSEGTKMSGKDRRAYENKLKEKLNVTKGKLDHASIVAFIVGFEEDKPFELCRNAKDQEYQELLSSGSPKRYTGSGSPSLRSRVPATIDENDSNFFEVEMQDFNAANSEISSMAFCAFK